MKIGTTARFTGLVWGPALAYGPVSMFMLRDNTRRIVASVLTSLTVQDLERFLSAFPERPTVFGKVLKMSSARKDGHKWRACVIQLEKVV